MFGARSRQPRLAHRVKIRAMTGARRRGAFTKRPAARARPIPNASLVLPVGLTVAARRIAVLGRKVKVSAIAALARKATEARGRQVKASPGIVKICALPMFTTLICDEME